MHMFVSQLNSHKGPEYLYLLFTKFCSFDQIEKNEMGWACSTYGGEETYVQGFGGET